MFPPTKIFLFCTPILRTEDYFWILFKIFYIYNPLSRLESVFLHTMSFVTVVVNIAPFLSEVKDYRRGVCWGQDTVLEGLSTTYWGVRGQGTTEIWWTGTFLPTETTVTTYTPSKVRFEGVLVPKQVFYHQDL